MEKKIVLESDLSDRTPNIQLNACDRQPWGFCVTPNSTCTANMCDEYGCQDGQVELGPIKPKQ